RRREITPGTRPPSIEINGETIANGPLATGGTLPDNPATLDRDVSFLTFLPARDWDSGAQTQIWVTVHTRPSLLYRRLQATLGEFPTIIGAALLVVASIFAIIELLALLVGIRLTRTMTLAVAELYDATQRVNRGDFSHRIPVTSNDQLAALESSFNSMTESLQKLLAEQKEKQRIENELVIAHEVQEQLFPKRVEQLESLEVYGLCRPARTVSGDYFDFLPLGQERLALAVGDISGKGISAALLMATLHSAVRSFLVLYAPEAQAVVPEYAAVGAGSGSSRQVSIAGDGAEISPAQWLAMLNRHLYHATPPEKYATLFLASYDGLSRTLTYSNGGHLPPVILRQDGSILRLEDGGTVVGLFDNVNYDEAIVQLRRGDIILAYSDGITEPENEFGEFGEARLVQLIRENSDLPLARVADEVVRAVQEWIGGSEQPDDITLVLARVR